MCDLGMCGIDIFKVVQITRLDKYMYRKDFAKNGSGRRLFKTIASNVINNRTKSRPTETNGLWLLIFGICHGEVQITS